MLVVLFSDALITCVREGKSKLVIKDHLDFPSLFAKASSSKPSTDFPIRLVDPTLAHVATRAEALSRGDASLPPAPKTSAPFGFDLIFPGGSMSFQAANGKDKREWMDALSHSIIDSTPPALEVQWPMLLHRVRDDTLHSAVLSGEAIRVDAFGLSTMEGLSRACSDLGHPAFEPDVMMYDPVPAGPSVGAASPMEPGVASWARRQLDVIRATHDSVTAAIISTLEDCSRELETNVRAGESGEGETALDVIEAFASGASKSVCPLDPPARSSVGADAFCARVSAVLFGAEVDMNHRDPAERTPLLLGAERGLTESVRALLRAGVDVAATDLDGRSGLHLAAQGGHASIVTLLTSHGAPVNGEASVDLVGRTPVEAALAGPPSTVGVIMRALVSAGATVSQSRPQIVTLVHLAVLRGPEFACVIPQLMEAGVDANHPLLETDASTMGTVAASETDGVGRRSSLRSQRMLPVGADLGEARGCGGVTPLHLACGAGYDGDFATSEVLKSALESLLSWNVENETPPLSKCRPGGANSEAVAELLKAGAKPNLRSGPATGVSTPLHFLARQLVAACPSPVPALRASPTPQEGLGSDRDLPRIGIPEPDSIDAPELCTPGGTVVDVPQVSACIMALLGAGARADVPDAAGVTPRDLLSRCGFSLALDAGVAVFTGKEGGSLPPAIGSPVLSPRIAFYTPPPEVTPGEVASLTTGGLASAVLLARRHMTLPTWVALDTARFLPDATSGCCMACGSEFGWFNRRHHCRSCNAIVCSACSAKTQALYKAGTDFLRAGMLGGASMASWEMARVCDGCFNKLDADLDVEAARAEAFSRAQASAVRSKEADDRERLASLRTQATERHALLSSSNARRILDEDDLAAERAVGTRVSGGLGALKSQMQDTVNALQLRGEKLEAVTEQSEQLSSTAGDFADLARQLEKKNKGFFGLF
jgi:ankyrin repeat protein